MTEDKCSVPKCDEPAVVTLHATSGSIKGLTEFGFCLVHCHEYEAMGYRR